ncbi:MAG: desulfoferrodoxin family protein, partial [Promethearchaeia archaeon]
MYITINPFILILVINLRSRRIPIVSFGVILALMAFSAVSIVQVQAHTPSGMTLEYDADTDELSVSVSHSVSDVNSHFIEEIVIYNNDAQVDSRTYTSQESTSGMSDTFTVDAVDGDVLKATAYCSISGSVTEEITIGTNTTTTTTTTTATPEPF